MISPIRTEHVGSLLRPEALLEARRRCANGLIDAGALRAVEEEAILDAVDAQTRIGIDVVTDGEFRRTDFRSGLAAAVSGLEEEIYERNWHGASGDVAVQSRNWTVTGPVTRTSSVAATEARFLSDRSDRPFKVTFPSPGYLAERLHRSEGRSPYASAGELAAVLGEIMIDEARELTELGVPYLQFDNPGYATFLDEDARERLAASGRDPDLAFRTMLESDRALIGAIPNREATTVGLHICRGNNSSYWLHQGSYAPIAEQLFETLPVDRFLLEFDDERSGSFDCLRFVPAGKVAVLGLVSTKAARVETLDELIRRLNEAATILDPAQLAISPQCGFATHAEGANRLTIEQQYEKLAVIVETAHRWFADR
ncbi:MAG TPA: cobalamin-independent methionine synthase II family protein [Solirubrobacteraceae bacterium]|nr:cobalamin-independent methionine synthase II family protein [Solirubrobacteraceae bacterium]